MIDRLGEFRFESEKAGFGGFEFLLQFGQPLGMGEVTRSQNADPLELGPQGQLFDIEASRGGSGEIGVDVKIGNKHGKRPPLRFTRIYQRRPFLSIYCFPDKSDYNILVFFSRIPWWPGAPMGPKNLTENVRPYFGFHTFQTLPTRSGPGFRVGSPGCQPAGVASVPFDSLTR